MSSPPQSTAHERLAIEAELQAGACRFVRERLRLPIGIEASFGWLRHPPSVMVVPRRADGRLLLLRRYRPAVGRWLLEFPSGVLGPRESPRQGGARVVRQLTGHRSGEWQPLGVLRPNPGYSDERMALALVEVDEGEGTDHEQTNPPPEEEPDGGLLELRLWAPQTLDSALLDPQEPVDGRSVTAWLLARRHWSL